MTVAIPAQRGKLSRAAFFRLAKAASGLRSPALALPMKAAPASEGEILRLLSEQPDVERVHLLGLGPERSQSLQHRLEVAAPRVRWSLDSNLWRSKIGSKGEGRPGPIQRALDVENVELRIASLHEGQDLLSEPSFWIPYVVAARARALSAQARGVQPLPPTYAALDSYRRLAAEAERGSPSKQRAFAEARRFYLKAQDTVASDIGLDPDEARRFFRDPDGFVHEVDPLDLSPDPVARWEWDYRLAHDRGVSNLERVYQEFAMMGLYQRRKAHAIRRAYRMGLSPQPLQVPLVDLSAGLQLTGEIRRDDLIASEVARWGNPALAPAEARRVVRSSLTPDLLRPEFRACHDVQTCHRLSGHCYVASEAFYHLVGGKRAGYTPMQVKHEGVSHWFVVGPDDRVWDLTAEQFRKPPPYGTAQPRGFLTRRPSARARKVLRRVRGAA